MTGGGSERKQNFLLDRIIVGGDKHQQKVFGQTREFEAGGGLCNILGSRAGRTQTLRDSRLGRSALRFCATRCLLNASLVTQFDIVVWAGSRFFTRCVEGREQSWYYCVVKTSLRRRTGSLEVTVHARSSSFQLSFKSELLRRLQNSPLGKAPSPSGSRSAYCCIGIEWRL